MEPVGQEQVKDPDVIGFAVTSSTTIGDVVDDIVERYGTAVAARFFTGAAAVGMRFPGLSANSTGQLRAIADSLTTGDVLDPEVAGLTVGPGDDPAFRPGAPAR